MQLCRVCKQEEVGLIKELIIEMKKEKRNEGLMTLGVLGIFEKEFLLLLMGEKWILTNFVQLVKNKLQALL